MACSCNKGNGGTVSSYGVYSSDGRKVASYRTDIEAKAAVRRLGAGATFKPN